MAWNDLTEREKSLDHAIDASGIKLNNSWLCLKRLMKAIGADPSEEEFVKSRIALRLKTQQLLNESDSLIEEAMWMLNGFHFNGFFFRKRRKSK